MRTNLSTKYTHNDRKLAVLKLHRVKKKNTHTNVNINKQSVLHFENYLPECTYEWTQLQFTM